MKSPQSCPGKEQLFAYAVHMPDPVEEQRVRTHLEQCPGCSEVVTRYQHLEQVLDEWKPVAPSPWFDTRTRARVLSSTPARPSWLLSSSLARWVAVAAVAVVVAVAGITVFHSHTTHSQAPIARSAESSPQPVAAAPALPEAKTVASQQSAEDELNLYKNLHVLENYDMLANFDVLSELPQPNSKVND